MFLTCSSSACFRFLVFSQEKHPTLGRLRKVSGPFVLCDTSHWLWGPTVFGHTYILRLQSEGLIGTRFVMGLMYCLSSANTSELSSSMRLGISANIAIDPLFEIIRPKVAINSCTSSVPSPTTMGTDPSSAFSFGVQSPTTSLKRSSFRPALWVHPRETGCS